LTGTQVLVRLIIGQPNANRAVGFQDRRFAGSPEFASRSVDRQCGHLIEMQVNSILCNHANRPLKFEANHV